MYKQILSFPADAPPNTHTHTQNPPPLLRLLQDMKLKLMEMGYTEKQVLMFETMSAEQLVHIFDEANTVVHKALKVARRDGTALVLPGLNNQLVEYRNR